METNNIVLREQPFELTHIKLRRTDLVPAIHYCVSYRQVKKVGLKDRIAGLFGKLPDPEGGDFHYLCHVTSPFLDEHIRSERVGFDIAEEQDGIFQDVELSFKEIDSAIIEQVERYLEPYLEVSREAGYKRITDFVEHRAPQYRPLLKRMRKEKLCLSPTCTPQDIELELPGLAERDIERGEVGLARDRARLACHEIAPVEDESGVAQPPAPEAEPDDRPDHVAGLDGEQGVVRGAGPRLVARLAPVLHALPGLGLVDRQQRHDEVVAEVLSLVVALGLEDLAHVGDVGGILGDGRVPGVELPRDGVVGDADGPVLE